MNFAQLLAQINSTIKVYEKHAELSGEKFNVFSIMGMESDEVRTHSSIIGELLNPKGSHSLGSKPLELFIKQVFSFKEDFIFDYDSSVCQKEIHIGKINEDKTEGGRVDLIVKDCTGVKLVIENKIYAPEQKNQLERYKKQYPNAEILYLTLEGDDAKSKGNLIVDKDYFLCSYKESILNWIENCAKEAFDKPMVREVLNQYLIRELTNQTTNKKMSEKIVEIIKGNYQESLEIYKNFEDARRNIVSSIFDDHLNGKKLVLEDNSVWTLKVYDIILTKEKHKTILISSESEEEPKLFFFISYRYSSPKLIKGFVSKPEELEKIIQKKHTKENNTVSAEIMTIVGRNDFVVEFKNETNLVDNILAEIRTYITTIRLYFAKQNQN